MAIKVIVAETAHLLVGNLGKSLGREAERGAPQPCNRLDVFAARIVIYAATVAARDDQWAFLLVFAQMGLHMHEARNIARLDRVRNIGHALSPAAAVLSKLVGSVIPCCCRRGEFNRTPITPRHIREAIGRAPRPSQSAFGRTLGG